MPELTSTTPLGMESCSRPHALGNHVMYTLLRCRPDEALVALAGGGNRRGMSCQTAVATMYSAAQPALDTHWGDDIRLEPENLALLQDEPPAISSMPLQIAATWRLFSAALSNNMWSDRDKPRPSAAAAQQPDTTMSRNRPHYGYQKATHAACLSGTAGKVSALSAGAPFGNARAPTCGARS